MIEEGEGNLLSNTKIKINAGGMIGGRNLNDGVSIFGNNVTIANSEFKPDFILNNNDKQNYPYIFAIYFNREQKKYFIRAYNGKSSDNKVLFIKLTEGYSLPLKHKEIICAGNIIFQVTPLEDKKIEIINLSKKEQISIQKMVFDPNITSEVTIGRDKKCDFSFPKDKSFSRNQTTFFYDEKDNNYSLPLRRKEIISAGNVIFEINPIENNKIEICNLNENNSKQIFDPNNIKEITIGRDKKCNFSFPKDKSFSRNQTTFLFDDKNKIWIIDDGCKTKSSTNGTWVFGTHSFPIVDQLTIEILSSKLIFTVRKYNNNNS